MIEATRSSAPGGELVRLGRRPTWRSAARAARACQIMPRAREIVASLIETWRTVRCRHEPVTVESRLLPLGLVTAAFAAGTLGLQGLALWLGLFAIPAAAAVAFVGVSDLLEGRRSLVYAVANSLALAFVVIGCAVRSNATAGTAVPP